MKYYDNDFLQQLNKARLKTHYAKIILLSFEENPILEIQGEITSGTLNVSTSSAIRRTLSLSMLVDDTNANITNLENKISLNKKVKIEVGLENPFIDYVEKYGNIIWFPQGIFVLSSVNSSRSTTGWSLSITAKDKMSLLDGSAGGTFPAPTVISDKYIYLPDGSVKIEYPVLRQIIYEAVNHYGGEDPSNIFINDLEDTTKMLIKYDGYQPIYYIQQDNKNGIYTFNKPSRGQYKIIQTGEDVGYKLTDFTYPGELVLNPGETVVTLLDKIVSILGNYEYFYDIEGHFIFQEIKNYVNKQSPLENLEASDYIRIYDTGRISYLLTDLDAAAAITQAPKYDNIKNDFYVWGEKSDNHPIHYHLAIDAKPEPYFAIHSMCPLYNEDGDIVNYLLDENQIIKIQAGATLRYGGSANSQTITLKQDTYYAVDSILNNNQYYSLKNPEGYDKLRITTNSPYIIETNANPLPALSNSEYEWREELYRQALYLQTTTGFGSGNNYYYEELTAFWRDLYDPSKTEWNDTNHWNPDVYSHPENLDFWLDLIDTGADIGKYSIGQIGRRTKTINKKEIKTIYNKKIPDLIFVPSSSEDRTEAEQEVYDNPNQEICQIPKSKWSLFSISSTGASCFDEIRDLLYQHLNYHTTISISCLPIYYLESNTILYVEDSKSGIIGNFQITQFSLPLTYNGTMSISAIEVFQRI